MTQRNSRAGSMYAMVLLSSAMVATIGLAALAAVRVQRRAAQDTGDLQQARLYARSAIELAMLRMANDASWRSNNPNGAWWSNQAIGTGSCTLEGYDPADGNLRNDPMQPVKLIATGLQGNARYRLQVMFAPHADPLDLLRCGLHFGSSFRVKNGVLRTTGGPFSTNNDIRVDAALVGNVEANSRSGSGTIVGTVTIPAPAKPDPASDIYTLYKSLGTPLGINGNISNQLISPASNPGGSVNASGVYYIGPLLSDMSISNTRVLGTLVIDAGAQKVTINSGVFMQPARSDYPTLIVKGNLELDYDSGGSLSEATTGVNMNPSGTPYQGVWDNDRTDTYPVEIQGLICASSNIKIDPVSGTTRVRGTVYCAGSGSLESGTMDVVYNSALYTAPPLGFTQAGEMRINTGGWQQISD